MIRGLLKIAILILIISAIWTTKLANNDGNVKKNPKTNNNSLSIESIGLKNASIEQIYIENSKLGVPKNPNNIGLYSVNGVFGIYDAHSVYNSKKMPFYKLKNVKIGDKIFVNYNNENKSFTIVEIKNRNVLNIDMQKYIDGLKENDALYLITCAGVYDKNIKTFTKRLIVKAVLSD